MAILLRQPAEKQAGEKIDRTAKESIAHKNEGQMTMKTRTSKTVHSVPRETPPRAKEIAERPYAGEGKAKASLKLESATEKSKQNHRTRSATKGTSFDQVLTTDQLKKSFFSLLGLSLAEAQRSWQKNLPFFYIRTAEGRFLSCEKEGRRRLHDADLVAAIFRPGCALLAATDKPFQKDIPIGDHADLITGKLPAPAVLYTLTQSFQRRQDVDCLRIFVLEMKDSLAPDEDGNKFKERIFRGIPTNRQSDAADKCVCHCAQTDSKPFLRKLLERWQNPEAMVGDGGGDYLFALTYAARQLQFAEAELLLEFGARADFPVFDRDRYITPMARMEWEEESEDPRYQQMAALLARSLESRDKNA